MGVPVKYRQNHYNLYIATYLATATVELTPRFVLHVCVGFIALMHSCLLLSASSACTLNLYSPFVVLHSYTRGDLLAKQQLGTTKGGRDDVCVCVCVCEANCPGSTSCTSAYSASRTGAVSSQRQQGEIYMSRVKCFLLSMNGSLTCW